MPKPTVKFERNYILLLKMLYSLTSPCGTTVKALEEELGVSRRTVNDIKRDLIALREVEVDYDGQTVCLRTDLRETCNEVLKAAGVAIPPTVRTLVE